MLSLKITTVSIGVGYCIGNLHMFRFYSIFLFSSIHFIDRIGTNQHNELAFLRKIWLLCVESMVEIV